MRERAKAIIENIDALFGDTSVGPEVTLDELTEIQSEVDSKIEALKSDLKNKREK